LIIFLLVCFSIPVLGLILLQNQKIQNFIVQSVTGYFSEKLQTRVNVSGASFSFINRIQLKDLYVEDLHGDTLLFADKVEGVISGINRSKKEVKISRIIMDSAYINFITDNKGILNLKFILDKIINKDDTGKTNILFKKIQVSNSRFNLINKEKKITTTGMNYADMNFDNLNFQIRDFEINNGLVSFQINHLSFEEKSGLEVEDINTRMSIAKNIMHFDNLFIRTSYSLINSEYLHFDFNTFRDFSDFVNKVELKANFVSSQVSFSDISIFAPGLKGKERFNLSGNLSGPISDLKGKKIILSYSDRTYLQGDFVMIGLPEIRSTFINLGIQNLYATSDDLKMIMIPGKMGSSHLNLPDFMRHLGEINYTGKFTGFLDDFVAYGNFSTDLGKISTDMLLTPDTSNNISFQGRINTDNFFIGKLLESEEKLGEISMSANIHGHTSGKSIEAILDGIIDSLELFKYNYTNIQLAGKLNDRNFDGLFKVSDPNIEMEFEGKVNINQEKPEFDFTANITRARPYFLNIYETDPSFFVSFLLKTNFTGRTVDDINGQIRLVNSLFKEKDKQVQVYDFILQAEADGINKNITIRSDIMDGDINGTFQFGNIKNHLKDFVSDYIPALVKNPENITQENDLNDFRFDLRLKNIEPVISFFLPDFNIANKTHIYGFFNPKDTAAELNINCPLFSFYGNDWTEMIMNSHGTANSFFIYSTGKLLTLANDLMLENIKISTEVADNVSEFKVNWDSYQETRNDGKLNLKAFFSENDSTFNPIITLLIDSSEIYFNDLSWNISPSRIIKDSTSLIIDSLLITHLDQEVFVNGQISDNAEDVLKFNFRELDLSPANILLKKIKLKLEGEITGSAALKDPYNQPVFLSSLNLENFNINGEEFGKAEILANWNNTDKKIHIRSLAGTGQIPTFLVEGDYYPKTTGINFKIGLDKFSLNALQPYADNLISDLKGMVTGELSLRGTTKKPAIDGDLKLMKTSMLVNYLKTRYNFTNDVTIDNNNIVFRNFEIFDEKGNKAIGKGKITSQYFKDFKLDLSLDTENFEFLNTTEKDNQSFYGTIFASGNVHVTGPPANLRMDINARSERNSIFYIPLYGSYDIQESNFIYWVNLSETRQDGKNEPDKYQMKVRGMSMRFNLNVTPDAEVQLIFDPKVGDIIRGKGRGDLIIMINTAGKFEIFGDINIEEGDYLFTLQNLINKKFEVERGGKMSWNGDPSDANIDLKAFYNLRTTIYPLLEDPLSDPNAESYKKRIPVDCIIGMTGKLMNPTISPDIVLPKADQQIQNIVRNNITTQEELMKQFISLLVLNNFYSSQQGISSQGGITGTNTITTAGITGSELLSNQLSHWLSQISKDFNIGLNYRPGDDITTDELEVALSTQIFNDRLSISGNVDVGGNQINQSTSANNIVGDFELNYKITEKLHVKGFNRANDNLLFQTSPYTQGVGVFYRESFNSLGELMERYKKGLRNFFSKKKNKTTEEDPSSDKAQ